MDNIAFKRATIWKKCEIIRNGLKKSIANKIIKQRIEEKLRIGYGLLFNNITIFEKRNFLYTNELLSFIVFWSILEELSKDWYVVDWSHAPSNYSWTIRGAEEYLIKDNTYLNSGKIEGCVLIKDFSENKDFFVDREIVPGRMDNYRKFMKKHTREISLSIQVIGFLSLKFKWNYKEIRDDFLNKLNRYRNKIDFIHGDAERIISSNISESFRADITFHKNEEILDFVGVLVSGQA